MPTDGVEVLGSRVSLEEDMGIRESGPQVFFSGVRAPWKEKLLSQPPHTGVGRCATERVGGWQLTCPLLTGVFPALGPVCLLAAKVLLVEGLGAQSETAFSFPVWLVPSSLSDITILGPLWSFHLDPWACGLLRARLLPALPGEGIGTVAGPPLGCAQWNTVRLGRHSPWVAGPSHSLVLCILILL